MLNISAFCPPSGWPWLLWTLLSLAGGTELRVGDSLCSWGAVLRVAPRAGGSWGEGAVGPQGWHRSALCQGCPTLLACCGRWQWGSPNLRGSVVLPEPACCHGMAGQERASLGCGLGLWHLPSDVCTLLSSPPPLVVV